jgi:ubiquinone/menaquinone biosynthesis C-methylase UbiE
MNAPAATPLSDTNDSKRLSCFQKILHVLLKAAFHLLYHRLAFAYDTVAWAVSSGDWPAWRRSVIPYLRPGAVLEVAHGTGTLSLDLADAGYRVTAFDLSPFMSRIARGKLHRWAIRPNRRSAPALLRADARRLPFRNTCFANAVSTFPADFILDPTVVAEIARCLQPGAHLLLVSSAVNERLARWIPGYAHSDSFSRMTAAFAGVLEGAGFRIHAQEIRMRNSRVLLIRGEREE